MASKLFSGILLLTLLAAGCNVPVVQPAAVEESGGVRAWFDAPLPKTVYVPPGPCQIVAHGASPGGIQSFELSVNGQAVSVSSPDPGSALVTLTRDCGVSQPGEYQLRIRALSTAGQWSGYADTSLIIPAGDTPTAPLPASAEAPTLVAITPSLVPATGSVSIERISSGLVYVGDSTCGPLQVTVAARATAPKGIRVVVLFYRFQYDGAPSGFDSAAMNPMGADQYQATLSPTALLRGVSFEQATLQYQVVVQQQDGDTSIRTPLLADIAVQACGAPQVTTCSAYTTKRTCLAHGCKWEAPPGMVAVYSCQNP
jgi:hypothetical protein